MLIAHAVISHVVMATTNRLGRFDCEVDAGIADDTQDLDLIALAFA